MLVKPLHGLLRSPLLAVEQHGLHVGRGHWIDRGETGQRDDGDSWRFRGKRNQNIARAGFREVTSLIPGIGVNREMERILWTCDGEDPVLPGELHGSGEGVEGSLWSQLSFTAFELLSLDRIEE